MSDRCHSHGAGARAEPHAARRGDSSEQVMTIVYVANEWDYGDPSAGRSFEHYNFYDSLRQMGHRIIYFDYFQNSRRQGNEAMNRDLEQLVKDERPDLLF